MSQPDLVEWALRSGPRALRTRLLAQGRLARAVRANQRERAIAGPGPLDGDPEVEALVELWSLGQISASVLQQIAQAAVQVSPRRQMQALASTGTGGQYPANITRDLRRHLQLNDCDLPEPYMVNVSLLNPNLHPPRLLRLLPLRQTPTINY